MLVSYLNSSFYEGCNKFWVTLQLCSGPIPGAHGTIYDSRHPTKVDCETCKYMNLYRIISASLNISLLVTVLYYVWATPGSVFRVYSWINTQEITQSLGITPRPHVCKASVLRVFPLQCIIHLSF